MSQPQHSQHSPYSLDDPDTRHTLIAVGIASILVALWLGLDMLFGTHSGAADYHHDQQRNPSQDHPSGQILRWDEIPTCLNGGRSDCGSSAF